MLKGYGTQFTPAASARLSEHVGMARISSGTDQFRVRQASGHARGFVSGALEKQVQDNLKRLGKRYNGARLCKEYRGTLFQGKVQSTVWNRFMGYGVWVIYSDGFEERIGLLELRRLMGLLELQGLLFRIPDRRECNEPVQSAPRVPQVEKSGLVKVIERGCFGEKVKQTEAVLELLLEPPNVDENKELEEFKRKFVGQKVKKWFQNLKGIGERFSGEVNEVWRNEECYFARVLYEDGDSEDMGFEELERLMRSGNAPPGFEEACGKPTYEDQWPIFEVSEEDLLFFSNYHDASVQAARNNSAIIGDKAAVDAYAVEFSRDKGRNKEKPLSCCGSGLLFVLVLFLLCTNENLRGSVELCSVTNFNSEFQPTKLAVPLHLWGKTNNPSPTTPKLCVSFESCSRNFFPNLCFMLLFILLALDPRYTGKHFAWLIHIANYILRGSIGMVTFQKSKCNL